MTDNSDGLVPDIAGVAKRSNVHIDLHSTAIAPDALLTEAGVVLGVDPWEWVLTGGEDHTLVATTNKEAPSGFRVIGTVNRGTGLTVDGKKPRYDAGWQSF